MFQILIFLTGLIIGSFLNCLIYRLETNKNFVSGRSFCPLCSHKLSFFDLIPIISFLFLKGRCRYCGKKISWQYPLVEIATGLLFLLIFKQFQIFNLLNLFYYWLITSFLIIIFVYDLKHYLIPDKVIYPAIAIALIFNFLPHQIFEGGANQFPVFKNLILGALASAGFFFLIWFFSKGKAMGFGDVKLVFFMGLFLGFPKILAALFFSFIIGAIIGMILLVLKKKTLKSEVPFGPFLVIGTFISLFFGDKIISWYLSFL